MKYRHNTAQDQPKCKRYDDTSNALIHMRTLAQPVCTAADSPTADSGRGMMKISKSTRGRWCGMAVLIAFVAVMLAATITHAQQVTFFGNETETLEGGIL